MCCREGATVLSPGSFVALTMDRASNGIPVTGYPQPGKYGWVLMRLS